MKGGLYLIYTKCDPDGHELHSTSRAHCLTLYFFSYLCFKFTTRASFTMATTVDFVQFLFTLLSNFIITNQNSSCSQMTNTLDSHSTCSQPNFKTSVSTINDYQCTLHEVILVSVKIILRFTYEWNIHCQPQPINIATSDNYKQVGIQHFQETRGSCHGCRSFWVTLCFVPKYKAAGRGTVTYIDLGEVASIRTYLLVQESWKPLHSCTFHWQVLSTLRQSQDICDWSR